jgi:FKBP-type peptidyl-prolyl cis-trans isomerase SlyD
MPSEPIAIKKHVELTYQITDDKGEIVERVDIPVKYVHGNNSRLFPKVELTAEEGFGPVDPVLQFTDDLNNVPEQFRQLGAEVEMQNDRGEAKKLVVSKIGDGKLTVDGNHPLAGKTITFNVKVVSVRDAAADELKHGVTQNFSAGGGAPNNSQVH